MDANHSGLPDIQKRLFWIIFLLVAIFALALRVYDISARPFHSDEGVNYHFIGSIIRDGFYRYSHANYHGPAYFYLTFLFTQILGMNDLGMRASAIVMGWGLLPLLLLLLRTESRFFVLSAAALLGFSCSQIFHSRYTIHEPLFVWSSALLGFAVFLWHATRDPRYHYLAGAALGLLITTKETFIITLFCIFFAFLAIGDYRAVGRDLWRQRFEICGGLILSACIILLLFSGGLQWPGGIREMFLAVPQWIGRNESDVGHFKPFIYYTQLLLGKDVLEFLGQTLNVPLALRKTYLGAAEPQFWFILIIPLLSLASWKSVRQFFTQKYATGRFFAMWSVLSWLVYSCVNYKTPWLIINMTLPLSLFLAWMLSKMTVTAFWGMFALAILALSQFFLAGSEQSNHTVTATIFIAFIVILAFFTLLIKKEWILRHAQLCRVLFAVVVIGIAARTAYVFNFKIPYGSGHPYCYVHTHSGMMELLKQIKNETAAYGTRNVLVATNHYWPLPYYLRSHKGNIGYMKTEDPTAQLKNYDILILDSRSKWQHPTGEWIRHYYRLSDVQESHTYFRIEKKNK